MLILGDGMPFTSLEHEEGKILIGCKEVEELAKLKNVPGESSQHHVFLYPDVDVRDERFGYWRYLELARSVNRNQAWNDSEEGFDIRQVVTSRNSCLAFSEVSPGCCLRKVCVARERLRCQNFSQE